MLTNRQRFLQHIAQTTNFPWALEIKKAKGVYMYDQKGKPYLDLIAGIGVSNIGHCHPNVVKAVQKQVADYMHLMVYGEVIQSPQVKLAEELSKTLPDVIDSVYFVNSGTEATEGALKLAKRFTGRTEIISAIKAYHGSTHGALSLQSEEEFSQPFRPLLPGVSHIHFNNLDDVEKISDRTAAVILETVQGEAGIRPPTKQFLQAVRKRCDETGTVLILDEIQCGFGRTGTFWAFEQFDIVPDVVLTAKGMGGGMPIAAFMASKKLLSIFTDNPILGHITTFGGHPVNCAASLATVKVIQDEKLIEGVAHKGELFKELLVHPAIKEVRGLGLMLAAQFESFDVLKAVIDKTIEHGVLTDWFLFCDDTMRIAPPLVISENEIREACRIILLSIDEVLIKSEPSHL
jgi:acetylornithine/succinyldiaminopimelate/putrescine aminotransferase